MQPKKFSEYTPITNTDGSEVIPILKAGVNATVKSEDLPISTATQTAIDAADADIAAHVADVANPHQVTKAQVGLGNADNTSDVDKPISTATQTALDAKATNTALSAHTNNTSNPHSVTKSQVGLGSVDNTSDINKPVSTAQATADAAVASTAAANLSAHTTNTSNPHATTKAQVGLGNADNTSDASKPVSTAQQAAIDAATFINPYTVPFRNNSMAGPANDFIAVGQTAATANSMARRTSTGAVFAATATDNNHAVNKAQMDTADALRVNKAGDTMSGKLDIALSVADVAYSQTRAGTKMKWGVGSNSVFGVYNETSGAELLNVWSNNLRLGTQSGVGFIYGTGFPEGVVTAPVGSIYIDTAATNGAIEWIKASGAGNTGWVVSVGYLVRNITSLCNVASGNVYLERSGRECHILLVDVFASAAAVVAANLEIINGLSTTLPQFLSSRPRSGVVTVFDNNARRLQLNSSALTVRASSTTDGINGSITYLTNQTWPATLPGTAV